MFRNIPAERRATNTPAARAANSCSWRVAEGAYPLPSCTLWTLKDLASEYQSCREQLVFPPAYEHVCCRCGGAKTACTLCKFDLGAMYTAADMTEVRDEMPRVPRRVSRMTRSTTVTIENDAPGLVGHIGGRHRGCV